MAKFFRLTEIKTVALEERNDEMCLRLMPTITRVEYVNNIIWQLSQRILLTLSEQMVLLVLFEIQKLFGMVRTNVIIAAA